MSVLPVLASQNILSTADPKLVEKAKDLEAAFLSEMLKATGLGKPLESFGGGAGEDAFSGFLTREYATMITNNGGIGLAESIVRALAEHVE